MIAQARTLRRTPRVATAPDVEPEVELPVSVLRALDGAQIHQRADGEGERFAVSLAGAGLPFMDGGPEQVANVLAARFPELKEPKQLNAAVGYLSRVVKLRKRELRRQRRGANWATNW